MCLKEEIKILFYNVGGLLSEKNTVFTGIFSIIYLNEKYSVPEIIIVNARGYADPRISRIEKISPKNWL